MATEPFDPHYQTGFVSLRPVALVIAAAIIALFWFFGLYILTAAVPIGIAFLIAAIAMPRRSRLFLPSFGVQLGYVLFLGIGLIASTSMGLVSRGGAIGLAAEIALYLSLLLWLAFRPGLAPVAILIALQSLELIFNAVKLVTVWEVALVARTLIVHLSIRTLAIALMIREIRLWKRTRSAAAQA